MSTKNNYNSVAILNSPLLTADGEFRIETISLAEAKEMVKKGFVSYIGHESTAEVVSTLLGETVPMNRERFNQRQGQTALVFKLKDRAPEGVVLSVAEIEKLGYELKALHMKGACYGCWSCPEHEDCPSSQY